MESKILNFPEAMKLASILSKYIDVDGLIGKTVFEVNEMLLSKILPLDYLLIIQILTREKVKVEIDGNTLLNIVSSGLVKNRIQDLLMAFSTQDTKDASI